VPGLSVHRIVSTNPIRVGDQVRAHVDDPPRLSTMRNHTATHLLHAALRQLLGTHVKQAGSVVEPPRLRFDFTHYSALDQAEIEAIERLVNEQILRNVQVETKVMPLDQAIGTGAMALFGEKYGDQVRVVGISDFSKELCGGTHVHRTGDIGLMKIVYEGSISAGVRRIEAITGLESLRRFQGNRDTLARLGDAARVGSDALLDAFETRDEQIKQLTRELQQARMKAAMGGGTGGTQDEAEEVAGVKLVAREVSGLDKDGLRALVDRHRDRIKTGVVVLGAADGERALLLAAVTKDATDRFHAGNIIKALAPVVGGKGGGRPDLAQAGGKDPARLDEALTAAYELLGVGNR